MHRILFLPIFLLLLAAAPLPDPVFYRTDTWRLHSSAGTPLVLVHGLGNDGQKVWDPLLPELTKQYAVLTVGLPGLGRTPLPEVTSPLLYALYTDWLIRRHFGERKVILTGHSFGGAVVLRHLSLFPERVSRAIIINGAGVLHPTAHLLWFPRAWTGIVPTADSPLTALLFHPRESTIGNVLAILGNNPVFTRAIALDPQLATLFTMQGWDLRHLLLQPAPPVTFLLGADDHLVPPRSGLLLHALLPGARLLWVPGKDHGPMRTDPAGFLRLFRRALAGEGDPAAPLPDSGPRKQHLTLKKERQAERSGGSYRKIVITGCGRITLSGLDVEKLVVEKSAVTLDNCRIGTLAAEQSSLLLTACRISGSKALELDLTLADLAGCLFTASAPVLKSCGKSRLVFSLCRVGQDGTWRWLHEASAPAKGTRKL